MKAAHLLACLLALFVSLTVIAPLAASDRAALKKIKRLVHNGSVILVSETGRRLVSIHADRPYVPASILKIVTAQVALTLLGGDFRFSTDFFTNERGDLAIRGHGDPHLISDEIRSIARNLKDSGVLRINRIVLDQSSFAADLSIPGLAQSANPYDALSGALVVNFNTIQVQKEASGKILSAEAETPLTPIAEARASGVARGKTERINLSSQKTDCIRYAGELFAAIFREQGIEVAEPSAAEGVADAAWRHRYEHFNSRPLRHILSGMLEYSNNFIANQIFLAAPLSTDRTRPASLERSRELFARQIRNLFGLRTDQLVMVEGSGISRDNRMTAAAMISVLEKFRPHAELLAPKNGHPLKSGTLTGVYNYAGYIRTDRGLRPFVIMLNQKKNHRDAILALLASL